MRKEQYIESSWDRTLEELLSPSNIIGNLITICSSLISGAASLVGLIPNVLCIQDGPDVERTHYIVTYMSEEERVANYDDGIIVVKGIYRNIDTYRIGAGEVNGIHWFDRKDTYPELIAQDQKIYFK